MKKINQLIKYSILLCLTLLLTAMDLPDSTLQERWDAEITKKPSAKETNLLFGKHVVFVAGLMNELADLFANYFLDNVNTVENHLGGTTSCICPSSKLSIPENAKILYQNLLTISNQEKKPLILVGHSKGAAEIWHTTLEHPELILDGIVDHVLLIQAAIGGSPLADDSSSFLLSMAMLLFSPNLDTLRTDTAKHDTDQVFAHYQKIIKNNAQQVSSRIFYVRSKLYPAKPSLGLSLMLVIMQNDLDDDGEDHDGMLPVSSQYDQRIGIDLGIVNADHIGLTVDNVSNVSRQARAAFTRLIFRIMAERLTG